MIRAGLQPNPLERAPDAAWMLKALDQKDFSDWTPPKRAKTPEEKELDENLKFVSQNIFCSEYSAPSINAEKNQYRIKMSKYAHQMSLWSAKVKNLVY